MPRNFCGSTYESVQFKVKRDAISARPRLSNCKIKREASTVYIKRTFSVMLLFSNITEKQKFSLQYSLFQNIRYFLPRKTHLNANLEYFKYMIKKLSQSRYKVQH